jgi:hypothetical protein
MRKAWKGRPSPALVISMIALFVALSGAAYAAIGKNAVKSKNIARGAVKTSDLAKNAVKTAKINNRAVTGAKIAAGVIPSVPNFAWAKVNANRTLTDQIGGVSVAPGDVSNTYCFDLPFAVRFAVVSTNADDSGIGSSASAEVPAFAPNCPATHQDSAVYTRDGANGISQEGFFIYFG